MKSDLDELVKSFPNNDKVQTEGRLAGACERRVLHGVAIFRVLDVGRGNVDPRVSGREDWGATKGKS